MMVQQLAYDAGDDLAQSTGFSNLADVIGTDDDQCACGIYVYLIHHLLLL
jgi:hypothetical protein